MVVLVDNQQLEDNNNNVSQENTNSAHDIQTSNKVEIRGAMMCLYKETMILTNVEEDNKYGSAGSISWIDQLGAVNASKEEKMELMSCIYKETICPMFRAEIITKQQKFLSTIGEKFGVDLLTGMTLNVGNMASTSGSQVWQLQFINGISTPISTGDNIRGKDNKPFVLALVDVISEEVVSSGAGSAMEVEIVVLEGDSGNDESKDKVVSKWNGRKVLQGNTFVKMKKGTVVLDRISFTHNSAWKGNRNCRIGARSVNAVFSNSVKAAKTEPFLVKDKRSLLYIKNPNPSLSDYVYRLNLISNRGKCFKRLSKANVKTVRDLLTLHAINPQRLKEILDVHPNTWKTIMDHALKCKDNNGIYLYHHPRDGQKCHGVVFNILGQLVGLVAASQFVPGDELSDDKRADARKLIISSSDHWEEVLFFDDHPSLINHLQSHTTLNSLFNNLNVVIPQTIYTHDHTSLTSPQVITPKSPIGWRANSTTNCSYDIASAVGQSQSPKRPAYGHSISNSPKKPRGYYPMSPTAPSVGTSKRTNAYSNNLELSNSLTPEVAEDDDYMQYLNCSEFDKWKMVVYVVGLISMISKVRKRRMTICHDDALIVISATMNN